MGISQLTIKMILVMVSCVSVVEAAPVTRQCSKKELTLKNCTLHLKPHKISFWREKFSITDGVSRGLTDLPLIQEKTEWETIRFTDFGRARFIEFIAWQALDGADIQTKIWYVYAVEKDQATLKLEKSLNKRLLVKDAAAKNDRVKKFGLKLENQQVHWFLDREKGILK